MGGTTLWVASAIGLGLAYAALPGVVNAEALRRGVAGGFRPALLVHLGALIGAAAWAAVALSGVAVVARSDAATGALGLVGAAFLFRLARAALIGALSRESPDQVAGRSGRAIAVGMVVSLANPAGLAFWAGLSGGVVASGQGVGTDRAALFLAGVLIGSLLWGCTMSVLVNWGRQLVGPRFFRMVNAICAVAFAAFGVRLLWTGVRRLGRWLPLAMHG
ncbi:MAG TPA: LysE family transporter [Thermomicrobiales bacterium]